MKILTKIIPLLLLVLRGSRAGDPIPPFPDTCEYSEGFFGRDMCGDKCMVNDDWCTCGSDRFKPWYTDDHCCFPLGGSCITEPNVGGRCSEGRKLSKSSPCNTTMGPRCYNSYQHSQYIGQKAYYTCPDTCVPWEEMCRGISRCEGDHDLCGPDLRCPPTKYNDGYGWYHVTKLNISSALVTGHHYCLGDNKINDGQFISIDRSDETQFLAAQSPLDLNISSFIPCNNNDNNPYGIKCGKNCRRSDLWCRDDETDTCDTGTVGITTNDPHLCRDPRVWANVTCSLSKHTYGFRCTGQNMRCVHPWYTVWDGEPLSHPPSLTQCPDKSDQVFNSSLTCRQHLQQHIDFHNQSFCSENYVRNKLICKNNSQWLSGKDESFSDPHLCQLSCSVPGPDCLACTNSSYFLCRSGHCLHPDLVCDGHPQCPGGEDEDLSKCYDKYIRKKIIQPLATYKCQSLLFENMLIFATPRNNIVECWDGSDEPEPENYSTEILVTSAIFIGLIYIALKYSGMTKKILSADNQNIESREQVHQIHQNILDYITLKSYSEYHDQNETIVNTNIHILNSLHTQKVDDHTATCKLFYELEHQIHENNESEIHFCLHKKMDPKVVENIIDSGEPGCTAGFIEGFENCVGRRLIMELQDKITNSPIIKEILGTSFGVIKVLTKYVDLFKDTFLTIVMLQAVGSFESVWQFKTNFSSVIVITMFSSILIPLLLSTLNLVVNRRKIINENKFSKSKKYATITFCWIASFLNPIILDAYYNELKEDIRKLTQNHDIRAMTTITKCRNIKNQIVTFHKTELGLK